MTIWFDTTDLTRFFQTARRPTGIQRLNFEVLRAAAGQPGTKFLTRARPNQFHETDFPRLAEQLLTLAETPSPPPPATPTPSNLAQTARTLPLKYRLPLGRLARAGAEAAAALNTLAAAARPTRKTPLGPPATLQPGDWLVNLGASWDQAYTAAELSALRARNIKIALLVHDMIPALFPEWCTQGTITDFSAWLQNIIPQTDALFTNSTQTQTDFTKLCPAAPIPHILPIGVTRPPPATPVPPQNMVLMTGSIEARKNHAALLRVWRRLLAAMPEAEVPELVFAGKTGWLTADLITQLNQANWLNGKIRHIPSPSESELTALTRACRFTIFPSLYEGLGLPVLESLAHGKTVAASNHPAIRQAGGDFCAYFDPENITDITNTVRALLANSADLEEKIKREFNPPSWADTAEAIRKHFFL